MNKDDIRKIARLGGITLNDSLNQKMEDAISEELIAEVTSRYHGTGSLNLVDLANDLIEKTVTVAIMDADAAAEREAEKNGILGSDVQLFVVDALKDSATQRKIVKEVKDMIKVLEGLMLRRIVSEMNKQLKERTNLR